MKKIIISLFFHILRMPNDRLLKQLERRNLKKKIGGKYVGEINKDLLEIGLTLEDVGRKMEIYNKLKSGFPFSVEHSNRTSAYSEEEQ